LSVMDIGLSVWLGKVVSELRKQIGNPMIR
jgi:hypothetical protein